MTHTLKEIEMELERGGFVFNHGKEISYNLPKLKSFLKSKLEAAYNQGFDEALKGDIKDYPTLRDEKVRESVVEDALSILTDEIATAHTSESGKTSRLTSAYNRIAHLKSLNNKEK